MLAACSNCPVTHCCSLEQVEAPCSPQQVTLCSSSLHSSCAVTYTAEFNTFLPFTVSTGFKNTQSCLTLTCLMLTWLKNIFLLSHLCKVHRLPVHKAGFLGLCELDKVLDEALVASLCSLCAVLVHHLAEGQLLMASHVPDFTWWPTAFWIA